MKKNLGTPEITFNVWVTVEMVVVYPESGLPDGGQYWKNVDEIQEKLGGNLTLDETIDLIESLPLPDGADAGDRSTLEAYETDVLS